MKIGVPKEIKDQEGRVAVTPAGVQRLLAAGHQVNVQTDAGIAAGFSNAAYMQAGATLCAACAAWSCDLVVKVKEPEASEYGYLAGQMVFTYFHLAGAPKALTDALLVSKTTAIAYETLEDSAGRLPLLAPMSAIAGNMAAQVGGFYLAKSQGGKGVQLGEVLAVKHGEVLVVGDGVVGFHAAKTAYGLGAKVSVAGLQADKAELFKTKMGGDLDFFMSTPERIAERLKTTDLLVGAVLRHGAKADDVITEAMVRTLEAGSVVVDVSIDQGGCVATSKPTSHSQPVFVRHGVIHYCVTNMPGAYPRTATLALTQSTLPYLLQLANNDLSALGGDAGFAKAVNTHQGVICYQPVAEALGMMSNYRPLDAVFAGH
jgi:alanine dehydrogenase